jgi:serine/threonine-protein kinase
MASTDIRESCSRRRRLLRAVALDVPDVTIIDIRMPPTQTNEGLVAAQRIRSEHPGVGVLVLSQYVEPEYALQFGAPRKGRLPSQGASL